MIGSVGGPRAFKFGTFELDLAAGELRKNGLKVRLQEQPFRLLTFLVHRPGDLVSREELREKLWPADTYVDFDNSLNTAASKLREGSGRLGCEPALHRNPASPRLPVYRASRAARPSGGCSFLRTTHPSGAENSCTTGSAGKSASRSFPTTGARSRACCCCWPGRCPLASLTTSCRESPPAQICLHTAGPCSCPQTHQQCRHLTQRNAHRLCRCGRGGKAMGSGPRSAGTTGHRRHGRS